MSLQLFPDLDDATEAALRASGRAMTPERDLSPLPPRERQPQCATVGCLRRAVAPFAVCEHCLDRLLHGHMRRIVA